MVRNNVTRRGALGGIVGAAAASRVAAAPAGSDQVVDMTEVQRVFMGLPLVEAEAATRDGQYFKLVDSVAGLAEVRRRTTTGSDLLYSEATTAALASEEEGKGLDLFGRVTGSNVNFPATPKHILLDIQVSRMLSGAGTGDPGRLARAAETAKFQAMCDTGRSFSVPEAANHYAVDTIRPARGQLIEGDGSHGRSGYFQFVGNGVDPVFELGDGNTSGPRGHTLRDLSVLNDGADCIVLNTAPDFLIERVHASSIGGSALKGTLSVRGSIRASRFNASGAGVTAVDLLGYFNRLVVSGVTLSGGYAGRAMRLGSTQGATLDGLGIEVSHHGLWIASTPDPGDGVCSGIVIRNFYVEQCMTPLVLAKRFVMNGPDIAGVFISNNSTSEIAERGACIQFGRLHAASIRGLTLYPHPTEDLFWIWLENASGGFEPDNLIQKPSVNGGYANSHAFKGAFAGSVSVRSAVGATSDFGFMGDTHRLGSSEPREWISPLIDCAHISGMRGRSTGILTWLSANRIAMGGKVVGAEIVDHDGGSLAGVKLDIGRESIVSETVHLNDLSNLNFRNGRAALPLGAANIFDTEDCVYRIVAGPGASARFRIRLDFRAN